MWNLETNMVKLETDTRYACPSGQATLEENGKFFNLCNCLTKINKFAGSIQENSRNSITATWL